MTIYTFESSQPLTPYQIEYLNKCLQNLPYKDTEDFLDVPESITEIVDPNQPPITIFPSLEECIEHIENNR